MKSGFDYKEYVKWAKSLGTAKEEFQNWLRMFLLQQAQRVIASGKKRTPVDTGFLRNSWYIGSQKIEQIDDPKGGISKSGKTKKVIDEDNSDIASIAVVGDYLQVEIGLSAEYASYVEYGHHAYAGRYMLTISLNEIQQQLPARFNKAWLQFIKSKGVV